MPSRNSFPYFFPSALSLVSFVVFTLVFINTAWVGEDAFITFRAVDNFLKGYGPVWNVGERVQVYTHPLWYALLILGIGIFKHHYWVTIALSYGCLITTLFLLLEIAKTGQSITQTVIALFVLLLSRAFMDYSSSGLENPLLHLLLAGYVLIAVTQQDAAKRLLHTSLLCSFVFLTRPDGIIIITPASIWMFWLAKKQSGWKRTFKLAAMAAAPAVAWEVFSLVYYGSLVPNTALAKVNIDYPRAVLLGQARNYFAFNLEEDPITLGMVFLSFALVWLNKRTFPKLLMAGVALQMLYICHVGADYMLGRFFSSSVLIAAMAFVLLPPEPIQWHRVAVGAGGCIVLLFFPMQYPYNLKYSINFHNDFLGGAVTDERGHVHQNLGLLPIVKKMGWNPYTNSWIRLAGAMAIRNEPAICVALHIGMPAWSLGEKLYVIDYLALSEPYLARLPARTGRRVGHYARAFPKGYLETIVTGKNTIDSPVLASLYDDVALTVRGPLWGSRRWSAIWRLNTGFYKGQFTGFDRDDATSWSDIIPTQFIRPRDITGFNYNHILLPLAVPPAFSPFIDKDGG